MTKFEEGWKAAERGLSRLSCPYSFLSEKGIAWNEGYTEFLVSLRGAKRRYK